MASPKQNPLDAKLTALDILEHGRAEISAEIQWLREKVNPKQVLAKAAQRHSALVLGGAFAAGLAVTLFLFRRKRAPLVKHPSDMQAASFTPPIRQHGFAGQMVGQAVSMLLPLILTPLFEKMTKRHQAL